MTPDQIAVGQNATGQTAAFPHDLSPWGMFVSADIVVQTVMVVLAVASLATWSIGLAKVFELRSARQRTAALRRLLGQTRILGEAAQKARGIRASEAHLILAAADELERSPGLSIEGVKERMASRLGRLEIAAVRRMNFGSGVLATVGATAPFLGLFGTVWGIMNSFIGISKSQTTNLAVVAPGIAEALLATALGLVAALPAVVIYNSLARSITGYRASLGDLTAEVLCLGGRDLDRSAYTLREGAE